MPTLGGGGRGSSQSGFRRSNGGGGSGLLTIVLVLVSVVMLTLGIREGGSGFLSGTRSVFQTVTSPLRMAGSAITVPFSGLGNIFHNLTADEATLSDLESQNQELVAQNAELEEAQQTAARLEKLLGLRSTYSLQSTAARIISGSTDSWSSNVTLDKGSSSGLAVGMAVVDSYGAIGEVVECGPATCTVRLLSDENSSISAMLQKSRVQGMVQGSADGTLHLTMISTDQQVEVGDVVVTGGLGGVFPKGLPIGTVSSVVKNPASLSYDIVVEPISKTENYEEVLVITSLTDDQEATADDISEADAQDSSSQGGSDDSSTDSDSTTGDDSSTSGDAGSGSQGSSDATSGGSGSSGSGSSGSDTSSASLGTSSTTSSTDDQGGSDAGQ